MSALLVKLDVFQFIHLNL